MQMEQERKLNSALEKTCDKCGHLCVCSILRALAPLLSQKWTDEDRPFEPDKIAAICRHFLSVSILNILTEDAR